MLRILIVDDHVLIRCGLKQILQAEFGEDIVIGEAQNAPETIALVTKKNWDAVIMDINLPGRSGLLLLEDVRAIRSKLPVLILSACSEEEFAVRVLRSGAAGFVPKESTHVELVVALKTVLAGGKHVTNAAAQLLVSQLAAPGPSTHQALSAREYEVLCLMGKGKTPTEISKALALSVKTVSTYRSRILEKLNLKTSAQLIHYAVTQNLTLLDRRSEKIRPESVG